MKYSNVIILMTMLIVCIMYSCAPVYVPNTVNAPLLTNKGEFQASLHAGTSGFDPQIAYAVSDHVGLMLNGSFMNSTSDSSDNYHKHRFIEAGAGYYTHFGSRGKFETFMGFGSGQVNAFYGNHLWTSFSDVKYKRFFIQPSAGFTTRVIDLGISSRIVVVDFIQGSENSSGLFFEPLITLKAGYDHVKAVGKLGLSVPFNEENVSFNYQPLIFSIGIQANFGKIFK